MAVIVHTLGSMESLQVVANLQTLKNRVQSSSDVASVIVSASEAEQMNLTMRTSLKLDNGKVVTLKVWED